MCSVNNSTDKGRTEELPMYPIQMNFFHTVFKLLEPTVPKDPSRKIFLQSQVLNIIQIMDGFKLVTYVKNLKS